MPMTYKAYQQSRIATITLITVITNTVAYHLSFPPLKHAGAFSKLMRFSNLACVSDYKYGSALFSALF